MKVIIDNDLCTGCEMCVDICPEVFEMSNDVALVKADTVPEEAVDSCREATEGCPTEAISIEE
ncbi:ferredoxin [candidate division NPL-UPA2 bacterium Unc8]|uniref:Ferredoxin n=1 Tax=candidate division NPL-UPA2 bacterium Unc8 TaxID=1980939 RepID=A0A399FZ79_UNCN2|nr:Ferredoxin [Bacillota bacterium]MBT9138008.1 Ferredoxin [Bacillota bacterium]MBT9146603.1 Ferredoxin [Bacillota bacterium]RII00776.1 MAG: ferredoxin [candidate division NPL-UPA2 bacterium Unc8]